MFSDVTAEVSDRLFTAESHLRVTCKPGDAKMAAVAKGMAFVQAYAAYEYAIRASFREAVLQVKGSALQLNQLKYPILSFALDQELQSAKECGRARVWETRLAIFSRAESQDGVQISDSVFPDDASHFRLPQLQTIWDCLGISCPPVPHPKFGTFLEELVENRNAVSHGRETPHDVGRRYSKDAVISKIGDARSLCTYVIAQLQIHCSTIKNLRR